MNLPIFFHFFLFSTVVQQFAITSQDQSKCQQVTAVHTLTPFPPSRLSACHSLLGLACLLACLLAQHCSVSSPRKSGSIPFRCDFFLPPAIFCFPPHFFPLSLARSRPRILARTRSIPFFFSFSSVFLFSDPPFFVFDANGCHKP